MFRSGERLVLNALFAAAVCVSVANAADPPPANELAGTWTLDLTKESELKGSQDKPNEVKLVFDGDGWKLTLVNEGGSQEVTGGYQIDAAQTPKLLDVTYRQNNETRPIYAIYELKGEKLTIGWRPDGTRPADLSGTVFDGLLQVSFLREKRE